LPKVPVESFRKVGLDRPCSSDWPYLALPPAPLEPEEPAEPDEPALPDAPAEPEAPADPPPGEAVGAAAPAVEPVPDEDVVAESHFIFLYCASVGES
jgi:hypothetical protein